MDTKNNHTIDANNSKNTRQRAKTQNADHERTIGSCLIKLRKGQDVIGVKYNRYISLATQFPDLLHTVPELEENFPNTFQNPQLPVIMEIGCYMGTTVVDMATQNPHFNILGVDIRYKRVVKSCQKIRRANLPNAIIAIADARKLIASLPDNSLYGICALFPDPWRSPKEHKHRFLNDDFFKQAFSKLTKNGFIWVKTDSHPYLKAVQRSAQPQGYAISETLPFPLLSQNHQTFFEGLFKNQNQPIYQAFMQKA